MKIIPAALLAAFALAQGPDPNQVMIESISYAGTGCGAGSVVPVLSSDATSFTLLMSEFVASSGPGTTVTDNRKNCQINLKLMYPQGFSYTITTVDYRGYVQVPNGITAIQKSIYYFTGQTQQVSSQTSFTGPINEDYLSTDNIDVAAYIWSPCGQVLPGNINTQVRLELSNPPTPQVTLRNTPGQITVDSIDGKVSQIYHIQWKTC
ncbi:hypothetical protein HDV06_003607 [Boothiomyces sp. JEL0866]|nr:hypothetical protein HDV06_003607 [Boothiomyces sp. JEL0866]